MNSVTLLPNESCLGTTTFFDFLGDLFPSINNVTSTKPVRIERAETLVKNKAVDIDDFIDMICKDDPVLEATIAEGSKWVADSFYSDEKSIRKLRLQNGFTQATLAKAMDTSQSYIAKLERAEVSPGYDVIKRLSLALNISPVDAFAMLYSEYEKRND